MTRELHNMSVPPTSTLVVKRATLAGRRFRVDLARGVAPARLAVTRKRLAASGWRAAGAILQAAGSIVGTVGPARARKARGTATRLEIALTEQLKAALAEAGVPESIGVFLDEANDDDDAPLLDAAAALAVLARRSGPLYLPARRFEPSLVRLTATVLFFPEGSAS